MFKPQKQPLGKRAQERRLTCMMVFAYIGALFILIGIGIYHLIK